LSNIVNANSIKITANKAVIDKQTGITHYIGNAVLEHNTMVLSADDIKIIKNTKNDYQIVAKGLNNTRASFVKSSENLTSSAKSIVYLSQEGFIKLKGDATLVKDGNNFSGEIIDYDNKNDKVLMSGSKGKQVKLKIKL
jgi:lipopolysaccharide transport protein LptA